MNRLKEENYFDNYIKNFKYRYQIDGFNPENLKRLNTALQLFWDKTECDYRNRKPQKVKKMHIISKAILPPEALLNLNKTKIEGNGTMRGNKARQYLATELTQVGETKLIQPWSQEIEQFYGKIENYANNHKINDSISSFKDIEDIEFSAQRLSAAIFIALAYLRWKQTERYLKTKKPAKNSKSVIRILALFINNIVSQGVIIRAKNIGLDLPTNIIPVIYSKSTNDQISTIILPYDKDILSWSPSGFESIFMWSWINSFTPFNYVHEMDETLQEISKTSGELWFKFREAEKKIQELNSNQKQKLHPELFSFLADVDDNMYKICTSTNRWTCLFEDEYANQPPVNGWLGGNKSMAFLQINNNEGTLCEINMDHEQFSNHEKKILWHKSTQDNLRDKFKEIYSNTPTILWVEPDQAD